MILAIPLATPRNPLFDIDAQGIKWGCRGCL